MLAVVEQPDRWQPFTANLRITDSRASGPEVTGRVFRRSDGSERNETGPAGGPVKVISIRNHEANAFFVWTDGKGWRRHPLGSPALTRPPRHIMTAGGVDRYQEAAPIEGLRTLKSVKGERTALVSPDLNMYAVVLEHRGGRRVELHGIRLEEPPAELFLPPPGAVVVEISTPVDSYRRAPPQR